MNPTTLLIIILSIIAFDFITEQILSYVNLKHLKNDIPNEMKDVYDQDKYTKSQEYLKVNTKFSFITSTLAFVLTIIVIVSGALGFLDGFLHQYFTNTIVFSLSFFAILFIASDIINIPFTLYKTFVIEEKFGFNKMTLKTFIIDKLKSYLLTILIGGAILFILLYLIIEIGENFWIYFWLFISVFFILINMFYASIIVPMFNKLQPLEEGILKTVVHEYSKKVNFPLDNIYVIDGSKRSSKANAFFSGIGSKKKIVLYDTLIKNHTTEELVAILAHEVGHYKKRHIIVSMIFSILNIGILLFILSKLIFNNEISQALGANAISLPINLLAFGILYSPISHITGVITNIISRKNEYEADRYAKETYEGKQLSEALKKLSVNNLSNLDPHPAYVFIHYSHPTVIQRLKALEKN